jgi:hypothetical protein
VGKLKRGDGMKYDELIGKLRGCEGYRCEDCELRREEFCNLVRMEKAADVIEELQNKLNLWRQDKIRRWIPVSERLPEDREIVIACWFNIHCIKKYNVSVLRFMKGRTLDEIEKGTPIYGSDQYGNNKVPYCWHSTEGAHDHFGQEVTHWIPLPDPPKEDTDVLL